MPDSLTRPIDKFTPEELYRKALENYFGSIIIVDDQANILFVNNGSEAMLKCPKEKLINMSMHEVVEKGLADSSGALEVLSTKYPTLKYIRTKGGTGMFIASQAVTDTDGNIELVCTYSQEEEFVSGFIKKMENDKKHLYQAINYLTSTGTKNTVFGTKNEAMKNTLAYAHKVSAFDVPIVIYGESGTGKEVLARYIYRNSKRTNNIFLPVNCAAVFTNPIEAEFFGYEKGSFAGAVKEGQLGLFEIAQGGTIFLDEIGEMPLSLQSKLLRTIETGEIRRLGSNKVIHANVRIIAATSRDLKKMVEEKTFREDLYYRLNVIPITVPPLRERKEDIISIAESLLKQLNRKYGTAKFFTSETLDMLTEYDWPGNVRELKNSVERMIITSTLDALILDDARSLVDGPDHSDNKEPVQDSGAQVYVHEDFDKPLKEALAAFEAHYITNVLKRCNKNVSEAAKKLDIHRSGLYKKLADMNK